MASKRLSSSLEARKNFVIIHGRSDERALQTIADIKRVVPGANLDHVVADFGSLKSVAAMATNVRERFSKLNVLVLNAGVLLPQRSESSDGIEMTWQVGFVGLLLTLFEGLRLKVNHLAHFLLTHHLLATLKANAPSRIVVVSSICHDW